MGEPIIIKFSAKVEWGEELPDVDEMSIDELKAYRNALEEKIEQLDAREPHDEESEEYEDWADEHEELEDFLDEVIDRLDELQG
jgi:hypothetical protein